MKVRCIDNSEETLDLTIDKIYAVVGNGDLLGTKSIIVVNDYGIKQPYYLKRFEITKDVRGCKYCNDLEPYSNIEEGGLLEIMVNERNKSLEVHYCGQYFVIDYDNEEVKIKYCPFCGKELKDIRTNERLYK